MVTSTRYIRRLVQACFDAAYRCMQADGQETDALELKTATVHWLRHTGISEDVKIRPREHAGRRGHAGMATTDHSVESDRRERHVSGHRKRIKNFYHATLFDRFRVRLHTGMLNCLLIHR